MSALDEAVAIVNAARRATLQPEPYLFESGMLSVLEIVPGTGNGATMRCRFDYDGPTGASSLRLELREPFARRVLGARETSGKLFPRVRVVLHLTDTREWDVRYLSVLDS